MYAQIIPKQIDNEYRGSPAARWVLAAAAAITIGRSLAHLFLPDGGAQSIATIPLDSFSPEAAAVITGMFAQWGLTQLLFGLLYVLVLWRYRSLIPLMWLFILMEYGGRLLLAVFKPFETVGTAPGAVGNFLIPPLALIMLFLAAKKVT